jgi:NADH-quinone oxidoreductase subunit C
VTEIFSLAERVKRKFPNLVLDARENKGDQMVIVKREGIKDVAAVLKSDPEFQFNVLMDLTAVDYLHWEEKEFRFEVIYNFYSTKKNQRLFVKALVKETEAEIDSLTSLWPSANWFEREIWDMFGIKFSGHPNLKRILMYDEFKGHALRKDYPYNKRQPLVGPLN